MASYVPKLENPQEKNFSFIEEKRLLEFLDQGLQQKKDFMTKLEEEKKEDGGRALNPWELYMA